MQVSAHIRRWFTNRGLPSWIRVGNVYRVPLKENKATLVKVLGLGKHRLGYSKAMLVETYDSSTPELNAPVPLERRPLRRYLVCRSFVEEGGWSLVGYDSSTTPHPTEAEISLWCTYDLLLDEVRQRLGLERLKYKGAQFTFSTKCGKCGAGLQIGFARCRNCRAIREEFIGWEYCVTDSVGECVLSAAKSDVKAPDGNYYWAPYFIDLVRAGKFAHKEHDERLIT